MAKVKMDVSWHGRRRAVWINLLLAWALAFYSLQFGASASSVVPSMAMLIGGIVGSYVFGAAWERVSGIPSQNAHVEPEAKVEAPPSSPLPWGKEPHEEEPPNKRLGVTIFTRGPMG